MVSLGPSRVDHIPAFRIALGLAIPMVVLLLTDHVSWAMFVGFGAFTGIYSKYEPTRMRFRRQSFAGAMLTLCVTLGSALSHLGESVSPTVESWTLLVVGALVAGVAATVVLARGLKPGGAIFPLFAVAAVGAAPPAAPIWVAFLVAGASASLCVVLGLLGHWAGERHPGAGVRPGTETWSRAQLGAEFSRFATAAAIAGVLGLASGLPFPYWAQLAHPQPVGPTLEARVLETAIGAVVGIVVVIVAALWDHRATRDTEAATESAAESEPVVSAQPPAEPSAG